MLKPRKLKNREDGRATNEGSKQKEVNSRARAPKKGGCDKERNEVWEMQYVQDL